MRNERLAAQLRQAGLTPLRLAETTGVDPKTVERWITLGRVPHPRHRSAVSEVLEAPETTLWPELLDDRRAREASLAEVLTVYPHRGAVPPDLWFRLVDHAVEHVDLLAYAALFLHDGHPELPAKLAKRAELGLKVRLLYGDPDSSTVRDRGADEGTGPNLAARIRLSLTYMSPVLGHPAIEGRQHDAVLYNSIYRFDDEMLVNAHVNGSPAPHNPVLHVRRIEGGRLFDHYLRSFEHVWSAARPLLPAGTP